MAEKSVHGPLEAAGDPKHAVRATRSAGRKMRSLLLDAASPLFRERGLSGTAITDIAAAADAFPSQITYYFRTKEACSSNAPAAISCTWRGRQSRRR